MGVGGRDDAAGGHDLPGGYGSSRRRPPPAGAAHLRSSSLSNVCVPTVVAASALIARSSSRAQHRVEGLSRRMSLNSVVAYCRGR